MTNLKLQCPLCGLSCQGKDAILVHVKKFHPEFKSIRIGLKNYVLDEEEIKDEKI